MREVASGRVRTQGRLTIKNVNIRDRSLTAFQLLKNGSFEERNNSSIDRIALLRIESDRFSVRKKMCLFYLT